MPGYRPVRVVHRAALAQTPVSLGLANQPRQAGGVVLLGHLEPCWEPIEAMPSKVRRRSRVFSVRKFCFFSIAAINSLEELFFPFAKDKSIVFKSDK